MRHNVCICISDEIEDQECGVCGAVAEAVPGPVLRLMDKTPICRSCANAHAPELVSMMELWYVRLRLGELLVFKGVISRQQRDEALKELEIAQATDPAVHLGQILVQQAHCSTEEISEALRELWQPGDDESDSGQ